MILSDSMTAGTVMICLIHSIGEDIILNQSNQCIMEIQWNMRIYKRLNSSLLKTHSQTCIFIIQPKCMRQVLRITKHMASSYTTICTENNVIWLMSPQQLMWNRTPLSLLLNFFSLRVFGGTHASDGKSRKLWRNHISMGVSQNQQFSQDKQTG